MSLLGVAAAMALLLGAIGIYGVISYGVSQRAPEIGIRLALGAEAGQVGRMILSQTMRLAMVGIAVGLGAALMLNRVISSVLFGVKSTDPLTFVGVCALLAGVAAVAGYLPARRASRVDPLEALRAE
jgi:ABC-type antimicrobial peptide transport system permease subunit